MSNGGSNHFRSSLVTDTQMRIYREKPSSFKRCWEERSSKAAGSMESKNELLSVSLKERPQVKGSNAEDAVDWAGRTNW